MGGKISAQALAKLVRELPLHEFGNDQIDIPGGRESEQPMPGRLDFGVEPVRQQLVRVGHDRQHPAIVPVATDAGGRKTACCGRFEPQPSEISRLMAEHSKIQWTEASWNPVTGCSKVSPGCAHCYAETFAERFRGVPGHPFEQGFDLRLWPSRLELPLTWRRPRLIFVNSMSDLFHEAIPDEFIAAVFETMVKADHHVFQVLTKREERLVDLADELPWPDNVWMGVSIENRRFVHRADRLRQVPAAVRFISAEPLLGRLEGLELEGIDWLIAGGESGFRYRPVKKEWVTELRDRCAAHGIAFFFKQWGGRHAKAGGRELDGVTHDALPLPRRRAAPIS